jgi:hypothetical protein
MRDDLTFLSERQNNLLLEQVFSASNYTKLSAFLDTFNFKPYKVKVIPHYSDIDWLYVNSLSQYADFIFNIDHYSLNADLICFRVMEDGFALLHIYHTGGVNNEPIPIINYFYPTKLINLPFVRRCREISKIIDTRSHRIYKNHCYIFEDKYGNKFADRALVKIESKHLIDFYERNRIEFYKKEIYVNLETIWGNYFKTLTHPPSVGTFEVQFAILPNGRLNSPCLLSDSSNENVVSDFINVLQTTKFPPLPEDIIRLSESGYLKIEYSFKFMGETRNVNSPRQTIDIIDTNHESQNPNKKIINEINASEKAKSNQIDLYNKQDLTVGIEPNARQVKNNSNTSDGFSQAISTILVIFFLIILFSFLYDNLNENNKIKEFPDRSNNTDENKSYNQSTTPVDGINSVTNNSINNSEKPFNTSFNNREFSDASNSAVKKETPNDIKNNSAGSAKTSRYVLNGPTKVIRIPMNREVKIYKSPNIKDSAYIVSEGKHKAVISDLVYYDKNDRQWIMIEIDNNQGWVSEDFLNSWFNAKQKASPSPSPSRSGKKLPVR